jgi:hypothetical protein
VLGLGRASRATTWANVPRWLLMGGTLTSWRCAAHRREYSPSGSGKRPSASCRLGTLLGPEGVSASLSLGFPRQRLSPTCSVAGALVWKGPICAERLQPLEYAAGFDR